MINFVEVELHNNVSGKDKLREKIIDKMNNSLHDYLIQITTLSEQLKKTNSRSNFSEEKQNSNEFRKEPFFIEFKEWREGVRKSLRVLDVTLRKMKIAQKFYR